MRRGHIAKGAFVLAVIDDERLLNTGLLERRIGRQPMVVGQREMQIGRNCLGPTRLRGEHIAGQPAELPEGGDLVDLLRSIEGAIEQKTPAPLAREPDRTQAGES